MSLDLDPLFVKGLRLLHSKSKDSTDQLKMLLDEVIAQAKHGKERIYTSVKLDGDSKLHIKKASHEMSDPSSFSAKHPLDDSREKKVEKRAFEKVKLDTPDIFPEAKIPKLESPQVMSYQPPSPSPPKLDQYPSRREEETDSSDDNADADDFAMEMGLACVICKQIEVTQGNQLIECQECHNLYHQECHRPPPSDYDVHDPRRVWYCAKCMKNMKKMATKSQKAAKCVSTLGAKEPVSQAKLVKSESSPPALILPFKRTELKPTLSQGSSSQSSANKPIGLAGLAANFGGRTTASTSSSTATASTRAVKAPALAIKSQPTFSSTSTTKTATLSGSSSLLSKMTLSGGFQALSTASSQPTTTVPKSSSASKGLGLLSSAAAAASSSRGAGASSQPVNGSHKVASCSPLMSADKRLQIMKKRASKLQEKRRLSSK